MPDNTAKSVQVEFTPEFKRNIRRLAKKYRQLQADVQPVIAQLEAGQTPGTHIPKTGYTVFKVRIKNSDIQRGKRSGYRMVYYLKTPETVLLELFPFKIRSGTKPLFIDQKGLNFAHDVSILARKMPCASR